MRSERRAARNRITVAGIALVAAMSAAAPAAAATHGTTGDSTQTAAQAGWPNDTFDLCPQYCNWGETIGGVIWGNRTSTVQGEVWGSANLGVTVFFEAYAGTTKIDSDTRTAGPGVDIPYNFGIGNPDLVGGFDRLKITICVVGTTTCSTPVNADRDGIAEYLT